MQIALAKQQDYLNPLTRWVKRTVALMWLNDGEEIDLENAREYAQATGYKVFTYHGEPDPIGRAKKDFEEYLTKGNKNVS